MQGQQTIAENASHAAPQTLPIKFRNGLEWTWLPILLVVLGLVVRSRHYLAAPSYWYDEAYVLVNVFDKSFLELTGPLRCEQAAPPAFLWTLRALFLTFGRSELAMRAPAFIGSILAVLAMIPLSKRIVGGVGRWWAIVLIAISQPAVFHTVCVKPYAGDMLATVLVLLGGANSLRSTSDRFGWDWRMLVAIGILAPWCSYPAVFSLAAVSIALALQTNVERIGLPEGLWRTLAIRLLPASLFTLLWFFSFLIVWLIIGRRQHSNFLAEYWYSFFLDRSSVRAAMAWIGRTLLKLGDYGTTGMGIPLLSLAVVGAWQIGRLSAARLTLIAGPLVLMFVACAFRFYPLEDRLFYFALPCLWLLAAAGVERILNLRWARWRPAILLILAAPLLPGAVRYIYWTVVVPTKVEYREAFDYVRERQSLGDAWWVSHPEVYEVYFGKDRDCRSDPPSDRRTWLILARSRDDRAILQSLGCDRRRTIERHEFQTVTILLLDAEAGNEIGTRVP